MWIPKEAVEKTGAAERVMVAEAIRDVNLTTGPAALSFPGPIRFDDAGRRQDVLVIRCSVAKESADDGLPPRSRRRQAVLADGVGVRLAQSSWRSVTWRGSGLSSPRCPLIIS